MLDKDEPRLDIFGYSGYVSADGPGKINRYYLHSHDSSQKSSVLSLRFVFKEIQWMTKMLSIEIRKGDYILKKLCKNVS